MKIRCFARNFIQEEKRDQFECAVSKFFKVRETPTVNVDNSSNRTLNSFWQYVYCNQILLLYERYINLSSSPGRLNMLVAMSFTSLINLEANDSGARYWYTYTGRCRNRSSINWNAIRFSSRSQFRLWLQ